MAHSSRNTRSAPRTSTRKSWTSATRLPVAGARYSDTAASEDVDCRAQDVLHVGPERPVGGIEVVDLHHLVEGRPLGSENLPGPGHSRGELQPGPVPSLHPPVLLRDERARAHEA